MSKETDQAKYEKLYLKEVENSKGILDNSLALIETKKEADKSLSKQKKETLEEFTKTNQESISDLENKCSKDILQAETDLTVALEGIKNERQEKRNALARATNEVKRQRAADVEAISAAKMAIEEKNKTENETLQAKYTKTTNSRTKEIDKCEAENKKVIEELDAKNIEAKEALVAQIEAANAQYFSNKKKLEDKAKKDIKAKSLDIDAQILIINEKIKVVQDEYAGNEKAMKEIIEKEGAAPLEITQATKKLKVYDQARNAEIKRLENEKAIQEKNRVDFEKSTNELLAQNLSNERLQVIDVVTKLQGEIDVNAIKLLVDKANQNALFLNAMDVLSLKQFEEKQKHDIATAKQTNTYDLEIEKEVNRGLVAEQLENKGIEEVRLDREYAEAYFDQMVLETTRKSEMERAKTTYNYQVQIENILAEIDLAGIVYEKEIRELVLNGQKEIISLKAPVYQTNNEILDNTLKIVDNYKEERIVKAANPFIDAINKKLENFIKKYTDLIAEQQFETDKMIAMTTEAHTKKMEYIKNSKALIAETDAKVSKVYDELESNEIDLFNNAIMEITNTNEAIIKAYNAKIEKEKEDTAAELDRLNKLNEEIKDDIIEENKKSEGRLNFSMENIKRLFEAFATYYTEQTALNEKTCTDKSAERKVNLNGKITELEKNLSDYIRQTNNEIMDKAILLKKLEDDNNVKKVVLQKEFEAFNTKIDTDHCAFEAQLRIQTVNLENKVNAEYAAAEKKMNVTIAQREKDKMKELKLLNGSIISTSKKIISNINYSNKNAVVEKNKEWWIVLPK